MCRGYLACTAIEVADVEVKTGEALAEQRYEIGANGAGAEPCPIDGNRRIAEPEKVSALGVAVATDPVGCLQGRENLLPISIQGEQEALRCPSLDPTNSRVAARLAKPCDALVDRGTEGASLMPLKPGEDSWEGDLRAELAEMPGRHREVGEGPGSRGLLGRQNLEPESDCSLDLRPAVDAGGTQAGGPLREQARGIRPEFALRAGSDQFQDQRPAHSIQPQHSGGLGDDRLRELGGTPTPDLGNLWVGEADSRLDLGRSQHKITEGGAGAPPHHAG